jgi:FAD synthase
MRTTLHGTVAAPVVAVVGVWDPFKPSHQTLLTQLRDASHTADRSSLAVLIDPAPGSISRVMRSYGTNGWPVYDSVPVRVRLILGLGVDAVLCVRFRRQDFAATAADFLDVVRAHVQLREFWLGANQFLGPGPAGSPAAVAEYARLHDFFLRVLPRAPISAYDERLFLADGRLEKAIDQVGRPPTMTRPRSSKLRLAWRAGPYRARSLDRPGAPAEGPDLDLELIPHLNAPGTLIWPDRKIRFLAFVSGPADLGAV